MGKHEVIKPAGSTSTAKSTERVRKHREAMRAKGYRLKSVWVPNRDDPAYLAEIARANAAIAKWERANPDEIEWMQAFAQRNWDNLPD